VGIDLAAEDIDPVARLGLEEVHIVLDLAQADQVVVVGTVLGAALADLVVVADIVLEVALVDLVVVADIVLEAALDLAAGRTGLDLAVHRLVVEVGMVVALVGFDLEEGMAAAVVVDQAAVGSEV